MRAVFVWGDLADPLSIINSHQGSLILTFVDSNVVWAVASVSASDVTLVVANDVTLVVANDVTLVVSNDAWVVANVLLSVVWNALDVVTKVAVDIVTKVVACVDTDIDVVGVGQQLQTHVFMQFLKTPWLTLQSRAYATQYWSLATFRQSGKYTDR